MSRITAPAYTCHAMLPTAAALLLAACGGGGGGPVGGGLPVATAIVTEAAIKSELAILEGTTTQCNVGPSGRALHNTLKLADAVETAQLAARSLQDAPVPRASFSLNIAGNCTTPGHFLFTSDHASGVTDNTIDFRDYCVTGTAGDTVYNGIVKTKEVGTPTANGPLISSHQMSTEGAVTIQPGDPTATLAITLTDARTVYGVPGDPAVNSPATPTTAAPDRTTVGSVVITETTAGGVRTHRINNLAISRSGAANSASVLVTAGIYTRPDGTTADIRTPDSVPAVVNITTGELLNGSILLKGANNTVAAIEPGSTARTFTITVDDQAPLADAIDCAGSTDPIETALTDLLPRLNLNLN